MFMDSPRLAIVGYGTMGKTIESLALQKGFEISAIYDIDDPISKDKVLDFDVAIDFTTPTAVLENIHYLAKNKKNIVIGTTGWYDKMDEVRKLAETYDIGILWGSNFSIGMQFFLRVIAKAAKLMNSLDEFEVGINDIHHNRKKDSPSGTAISLANLFIKETDRYNSITLSPEEAVAEKDKLPITALRLGNVVGKHSILIDSPYESIEFVHSAKNRNGFSLGVLEAASWINDKKGFFSFDEVLESKWK
jgi:4-hydroxy-tetrahydrodipicolinate reductase